MVHIVSGAVDSGKTREMAAIHAGLKMGDGFLSIKIYEGPDRHTGYELVHLASGKKVPLALRSEFLPPGWDEAFRCGPYVFSRAAMTLAGEIIANALDMDMEPLFLDEIGPLELSGRGFAPLLEKVLQSRRDVYIAVRSGCLQQVIEGFHIGDHRVLFPTPR